MNGFRLCSWAVLLVIVASSHGASQEESDSATPAAASESQVNACLTCHSDSTLMVGDLERLLITEQHLADDIHWQKGLSCHDCHGGDASEADFRAAHFRDSGFRSIKSAADIPGFCGHCHSNPQYMRQYQPSPRTDQEDLYWTSGHGQKLKETGDEKVATCVSCHGSHNVRAVKDLSSPVYPTQVAITCGACHSDSELMEGRVYKGKPIGHDQLEDWKSSVHGQALLEKGDLSAPTCNDCHGNHGALPPEVGAVGNACGSCHVKIGKLFAETLMKHRFEEVSLPGCATCHGEGKHAIDSPTDEMLGMDGETVCSGCHNQGGFGATYLGAKVAQDMRNGLEKLKDKIVTVSEKLDHAERLGMEVRTPRFRLREANDALENARTLIHSFAIDPVQEALETGLTVSQECEQKADAAVDEYTNRRIWLALSLVPILVVIGFLMLYIRTLPLPGQSDSI